MMAFQIIETTKRQPCCIFEGYRHRRRRENANNVVFWTCIKQRKEKCTGSVKTKGDKIIHSTSHACEPDFARTEVEIKLSNARKRIREEDTPASVIYKEEFGSLHDGGCHLMAKLPQPKACQINLNRIRRTIRKRKKKEVAENSSTSEGIEITNNILDLQDGSKKRIVSSLHKVFWS